MPGPWGSRFRSSRRKARGNAHLLVDDPEFARGRLFRRIRDIGRLQATADQLADGSCARRQAVLEPPVVDGLQFVWPEHELKFLCPLWRTGFGIALAVAMVLLVIAVLLPRDDAPLDGQPPTDAQNAENGAAAGN